MIHQLYAAIIFLSSTVYGIEHLKTKEPPIQLQQGARLSKSKHYIEYDTPRAHKVDPRHAAKLPVYQN